jgi:hypothetical protein
LLSIGIPIRRQAKSEDSCAVDKIRVQVLKAAKVDNQSQATAISPDAEQTCSMTCSMTRAEEALFFERKASLFFSANLGAFLSILLQREETEKDAREQEPDYSPLPEGLLRNPRIFHF